MNDLVRSTCSMCQMACGILIQMDNGKPVKIIGDPEHPVNRGHICVKAEAALELLYHPDRLKHPLKRAGDKGSGKWERISWDEAWDLVASKLMETKKKFGPESIVFMRGAAKGLQEDYMTRFANILGAPNISSMAHNCFVPRRNSAQITYGFFPRPDYEYPPSCLILWGMGPAESRIGEYHQIIEALDRGTKLVVVDPLPNRLLDRAFMHLRLRPGSDLALALGMMNVIINEELYDKQFVDKWTSGFDELREHVKSYSPDKVAEITWVAADEIKAAARFYASNKPACIQHGNGIDQGVNSFQNARAIDIMRSICGNLGIPGGELKWSGLAIHTRHAPEMAQADKISKEARAKRISAKDSLLPIVFYALPQTIVKSILYGDPYYLKAGYIQGGNVLLTFTNSARVKEALGKLDFLVVADLFMTPTAAMADVVFPVASFLEWDGILAPPYYEIASVQQKIAQVGESLCDYDILKGLAKRMGFGEYFPEDIREIHKIILEPGGFNFDEFRKIGFLKGNKLYRHYEKEGFKTPSGKVEIYSSQLKEWGFDPLPVYYENPETPFSDPKLAKEYPLIFTSRKLRPFRHTDRMLPLLRGLHPEPITTIHPDTAKKLGINEGDMVYIETKRGKIKQRAAISSALDPRVVEVDYGWWFPEKGIYSLYGMTEANINMLTSDEPPFNREMGSPVLRGFCCKVYKAS